MVVQRGIRNRKERRTVAYTINFQGIINGIMMGNGFYATSPKTGEIRLAQ
jgi:hypothetical protein